MNIKDTCYVAVIIMLIMAGCATPLGRFNKQQKVVDNIKTEVDVNKDKQVESGRTFVYAADQSLQKDPSPSQHSAVAKQMTTRSLTALGPPQMENVVKSDQMINKLLSHDPKVVEEGQAELMTMYKQLIAFQNQNRLLNSQLGSANQKLKAVNENNAIQATKYASLMGKVYWIVGIVIFLVVLGVALKVLTAVAPFALPSKGASSTLLKVVQGIQKVRDQHMGEKPEMLKQIDDHMRSHLDKKDRWMIAQAKQKLHMI
jgi:hypothetical protein